MWRPNPRIGGGEANGAVGTFSARNGRPGRATGTNSDNDDPSAWRDLPSSLAVLLAASRSAGIRIGVEPEGANVIAGATHARRQLDELAEDAELIGIVLDPSNLVEFDRAAEQDAILEDAFAELAAEIVCLHAKDVVRSGYTVVGMGLLDYELILRLRSRLPRPVPVIVQDTTEDDAPLVRDLLTNELERYPWRLNGPADR